jgi:predicted MFS family arabinose efflux permease
MLALPVMTIALVAGALADRFDRRRLLIGIQFVMALLAGILTYLTWADQVTPSVLLGFTFLMGVAMAINIPAWQAIIPELVPRHAVPAAVGLGSVSFNMARTLGPAIGGYLVAWKGSESAFAINTLSFTGIIIVLSLWKRAPQESHADDRKLSLGQSILAGVRFVISHATLRSALSIIFLFVFPASCFWSLLPLIVREQLYLGPEGFGTMVGLFGAGAVSGAFVLPFARERIGSNGAVFLSMLTSSLALFLVGFDAPPELQVLAMPILGLSWMCLLTTLQSTAQIHLPNRLRARGMACYLTLFAGNMAIGSFVWGQVGQLVSVQAAFISAALLLAIFSFVSLLRPIGSIE